MRSSVEEQVEAVPKREAPAAEAAHGRLPGAHHDERIYAFDLLRGCAALAVALPHFSLTKAPSTALEAVSVIAVEIFFVLSGFVLAPQLLKVHAAPSFDNLRVFYLRRWLRTVIPYLIALTLLAVPLGLFLTWPFLGKLFFVDTFLGPYDPDFYAISWSLAVEEFYYLTAALCVFLFPRTPLLKVFLIFVGVFALTKVGAAVLGGEWAGGIRRGVVFRLDAIAFGFLLFHFRNRPWANWRTAALLTAGGLLAIVAAMRLIEASVAARAAELLLVYGFSVFSLGVVLGAYRVGPAIRSRSFAAFCAFCGAISYPVYLFHLHVAYALQRLGLSGLSGLLVFAAATIGLAWLFHDVVERWVIRMRPAYARPGAARTTNRRRIALVAAPVLVVAAAAIAVEAASYFYIARRDPEAVSPLFFRPAGTPPAPTANFLEALDPQLGYGHARNITLDTKAYGTSYEPGFWVHRPKKGNAVRIYVLGGSPTDALVAIAKRRPPWTYYLYEDCRAGGFNCGIWNGGVGGFGTPQEIIKLVRDVVPAKPDLVIGLHGPNELNRNSAAPYTVGFQEEQLDRLADRGSLWFGGVMPNALTALSMMKTGDDRPYAPSETYLGPRYRLDPFERWAANVSMMNAIAADRGFPYRTVLQPLVGYGGYRTEPELFKGRGPKYFELVRSTYERATAFCRTVDYCIDLSRLFDGKTGLYSDARHPNDAGNRLIADALFTELAKQGLLDRGRR